MHDSSSKVEQNATDLEKLREMAKMASIYHRNRNKFRRNPNLSHVVHAGLNMFQFIVVALIVTFHHVHHHVNRGHRAKDDTVSYLPEEANSIFIIYPFCMIMSLVFAVLWLSTNIFMKHSKVAAIGCFTAAALLLTVGIVEMAHVDQHIDLSTISDEDLLVHPVYLHNFIMCVLSVFCMAIYMVQAWTLVDFYLWKKRDAEPEEETDTIRPAPKRKPTARDKMALEVPGELHPIAHLESFPTLAIPEPVVINDITERNILSVFGS